MDDILETQELNDFPDEALDDSQDAEFEPQVAEAGLPVAVLFFILCFLSFIALHFLQS